MPEREAAIDKDILKRPLGEISAVQFLNVLNDAKIAGDVVALLPDKKKYELWVDESDLTKLPLGVLIEKIRREKKKLELEKRFDWEHLVAIKRFGEFWFDRGSLIDPAVREGLIDEIVGEVVKRLGK